MKKLTLLFITLTLLIQPKLVLAELSAQDLYINAYAGLERIEANPSNLSKEEFEQIQEAALNTLHKLRGKFPDWESETVLILKKSLELKEWTEVVVKKEDIVKEQPASTFDEESFYQAKLEQNRLQALLYLAEQKNQALSQEVQSKSTRITKLKEEQRVAPLASQTSLNNFPSIVKKDQADNPKTNFFLGMKLMQEGAFDKAIDSFKKSIAQSPSTPEIYYYKGIALEKLGRKLEAIEEYKNAFFLNQDYYEPSVKLGLHLFAQRQFDQALKYFSKTVEFQPKEAINHYNLGATYAKLKQFANAQISFEKALVLNSNYFLAHRSLGNLFLIQDNKKEGKQHLEMALALNEKDSVIWNTLGNLYLEKGEIKKAIAALEKSLSLEQSNALACNNLAILYSQTGKYKLAIEWGKKAVSLSPEFALAHYNLGSACYRDQNYSLAQKHLKEALNSFDQTSPFLQKAKKMLRAAEKKVKKENQA